MKRKMFAKVLACLVSLSFSGTASATLLKFNATNLGVSAGGTFDSVGMTVDGISVTISAYTIDNDGIGNISSQSLLSGGRGVYVSSLTSTSRSGNLGVRSNTSGDGKDLDAGSTLSDLDEGLLFSFNQRISLDYINFDSFGSGDDFNLTVDGVRVLWDHNANDSSPLVTNVPGEFDEYNFNGITGEKFLVWADGSSDSFRIDRVEVSPAPVPEPGTIILMGSGLAGLAFVRLRKKKADK
ncbi:MAG: PEP-CTERM sorting domain-containing protein [Nitrospiria bacterium]